MARKIRKKQGMLDSLTAQNGYLNEEEMLTDCVAGLTNSLRVNSLHLNATGYIHSSKQLHRVGKIRVLAVKETDNEGIDFLSEI